jgi:glutamine amidotransferase
MSIVILDYGIGNVKSILNAFEKVGINAILSRERNVIFKAKGIVLPGVGAFYQGMNNLNKYGLVDIIKEYVKTRKPLLGICLGMQMLLEESEEFGVTKGIGLIKGKVIKIPIKESNKIKLPHISWNEIKPKNIQWQNTILNKVDINSDMYFVHSYVVKPDNNDEILSTTNYFDAEFCSALKKDNIYGCQFHPEKSARSGLQIIKNFINICK